ncbi:MAG: glycosyltransferase [Blastocatellia bacterium]|nr:glycosyltransferase [Blastocatellia bacterium]
MAIIEKTRRESISTSERAADTYHASSESIKTDTHHVSPPSHHASSESLEEKKSWTKSEGITLSSSSFKTDTHHRSRTRIVRIIDRLNIGGPAKHTVWLTGGLDRDEFETTLVTGTVPPGEGDMGYFAKAEGVRPIIIKEMSRELSPADILVLAKLLGLLFRLKPDIVHTHKSKAGAIGRLAAIIYKWATPSALLLRPRRCRIVHTYHGHIFHSYYGRAKTRLFITIERVLARFTDRIIAISQKQQREICEEFRVGRPERFRVIPLGIDLDETAAREGRLRAELGIDDSEVLICTVGRLCEVKNYAMLIRAAARLASIDNESSSRARFVIIGDGPLRKELEQLSQSLDIGDKIAFTGFREDAPLLYADLDMVALTSLNEGTPLTLIEAMSCGRAVVATEVGGVVDIMGAHLDSSEGFSIWEHGLTVPSQDEEAYARALRFLINRPRLRAEMGERGRAFVRAGMSRERLVSDIEKLYRELTGRA